MKSPILVGFFLAGLVIHGGVQGWWISVLLTSIENELILMVGATVLTAFNDNAAITYLASQAPGLSIGAKSGQSILGRYFKGGVAPLNLAKSALVPTIIVGACFMIFRTSGMKVDPKPPKMVEPAEKVESAKAAPNE